MCKDPSNKGFVSLLFQDSTQTKHTMHSFWPFHIHLNYHHHHKNKHRHHDGDYDDDRHEHEDDASDSTIRCSSSPQVSDRSSSSLSSTTSCLVDGKKRRCPSIGKHFSVSFYPQVTQFDHIHSSEYTNEERRKTWYNRNELKTIQDENLDTVKWMLNGCPTTTVMSFSAGCCSVSSHASSNKLACAKEYCSRGVECRTPVGIKMRARRHIEAVEATLDYQHKQWDHHRQVDPIQLAEVSKRRTQESTRLARMVGQVDREHARAYSKQQC